VYSFKNQHGDYIERDLSVDELMDLPEENGKSYIVVDGVKYHRSMSGGAVGFGDGYMQYDHADYPRVSHAMPRFLEGAEHVKDSGKNHGKVIIESARQAKELCRRHGFTRDYDPSSAPPPKRGAIGPKAPWES
jgi:predicted heme/steroid binding protein